MSSCRKQRKTANDFTLSSLEPIASTSTAIEQLDRRFQNAGEALKRWKKKHEIEVATNKELEKRIKSWKSAYRREKARADAACAALKNAEQHFKNHILTLENALFMKIKHLKSLLEALEHEASQKEQLYNSNIYCLQESLREAESKLKDERDGHLVPFNMSNTVNIEQLPSMKTDKAHKAPFSGHEIQSSSADKCVIVTLEECKYPDINLDSSIVFTTVTKNLYSTDSCNESDFAANSFDNVDNKLAIITDSFVGNIERENLITNPSTLSSTQYCEENTLLAASSHYYSSSVTSEADNNSDSSDSSDSSKKVPCSSNIQRIQELYNSALMSGTDTSSESSKCESPISYDESSYEDCSFKIESDDSGIDIENNFNSKYASTDRDIPMFDSFLIIGIPDHWDLSGVPCESSSTSLDSDEDDDNYDEDTYDDISCLSEQEYDSNSFPPVSASPARKIAARMNKLKDQIGSKTARFLNKKTPSIAVAKQNSTSPTKKLFHSQNETVKKEDHFNCYAPNAPVYHSTGGGRVKPEILMQFPKNNTLPCGNIPDYCFPWGVQVKTVPLDQSMTKLNDILCGASPIYRGDSSFVFSFCGDLGFRKSEDSKNGSNSKHKNVRQRMYGVCTIFPSIHTSIPPGTDFSSGCTRCVNKAYCLLSRKPFLDLHLRFLWDILSIERVTRVESVALLMDDTEQCIEELGPIEMAQVCSAADVKSRELVLEAIHRYRDLPPPYSGRLLRFSVQRGMTPIEWVRPRMHHHKFQDDTDKMPLHMQDGLAMMSEVGPWSIPSALSWIPPHMLLFVIGALLCENQVIVTSRRAGLLTSTVLALASLMRPLLWVGLLIPVLPVNMWDFLDAPVPYLVGLLQKLPGQKYVGSRKIPTSKSDLQTRQVLLDLDLRVVFVRDDDMENNLIAPLPGTHELLDKISFQLKTLSSDMGTDRRFPLYEPSAKQAKAAEAVREMVSAHIAHLCSEVHQHADSIRRYESVSDPWAEKNRKDIPFMKTFVETQLFLAYRQTRASAKTRLPSSLFRA